MRAGGLVWNLSRRLAVFRACAQHRHRRRCHYTVLIFKEKTARPELNQARRPKKNGVDLCISVRISFPFFRSSSVLRGSSYAAFTNTLLQSRKVHENLTCTQPARQLFNAFLRHTPAGRGARRAAAASQPPSRRVAAPSTAPVSAPPSAAKKTAASKRTNCHLGVCDRVRFGAGRRADRGALSDAAHATSIPTLLCFQIRRDYETRGRYWQADCRSGARGRRMNTGARRGRREKSAAESSTRRCRIGAAARAARA